MPECQQGTQRRSGVPQTSAWCQKLASPCGVERDPLRQARGAPTHARTDRRAADLCSPLWPLIFEAQYNLKAVFTFLCHLTKYKAVKRERKGRGSRCARRLPPHPPRVHTTAHPHLMCYNTDWIPFRQWDALHLYPKVKIYPVWFWGRNDLKPPL